jgi:hypothetical protein
MFSAKTGTIVKAKPNTVSQSDTMNLRMKRTSLM